MRNYDYQYIYDLTKKITISCVNYLNTLPLIKGLSESGLDNISVLLMKPKDCFRTFKEGSVDVSLVPSGALHSLENYSIFGNTCIGSLSDVYSVALFSNDPIAEITTIYLDNHSTTSVALLQILMSKYIQKEVIYIDANVADIRLKDREAVLMIGDKAFDGYDRFRHVYDLGKLWREFTGLPFVYACWVTHPSTDISILSEIDQALVSGSQNIEHVLLQAKAQFPNIDVKKYFTEHIDYKYDNGKKEALKEFCALQKELILNKSELA